MAFGIRTTGNILIQTQRQELNQKLSLLRNSSQLILRKQAHGLENMEQKIQMLSPSNILKRGYSITRQQGKVIFDADQLQPDMLLETELFHGKITSKPIKNA